MGRSKSIFQQIREAESPTESGLTVGDIEDIVKQLDNMQAQEPGPGMVITWCETTGRNLMINLNTLDGLCDKCSNCKLIKDLNKG